jgi:hypothetical protein
VTAQRPLPCSEAELFESFRAYNEAADAVEAAKAKLQRAKEARSACLASHGVLPDETQR